MKKVVALTLCMLMILSTVGMCAFANNDVPLPTGQATRLDVKAIEALGGPALRFAMNFVADKPTDEQIKAYDKWFIDFEVTFNKDVKFRADGDEVAEGADGYLAGQYDNAEKWGYPDWICVPFDDPVPVELQANTPFLLMKYASEKFDEPGLRQTYRDIYKVVQDFDCGIYFTDKYLIDNPDLAITLSLVIINPDDQNQKIVVGEEHKFYGTEVHVFKDDDAAYKDKSGEELPKDIVDDVVKPVVETIKETTLKNEEKVDATITDAQKKDIIENAFMEDDSSMKTRLDIELKQVVLDAVIVGDQSVKNIKYDVRPIAILQKGDEVKIVDISNEQFQEISFRLAIPENFSDKVLVIHTDDDGLNEEYPKDVQEDETGRFVNITVNHFSDFNIIDANALDAEWSSDTDSGYVMNDAAKKAVVRFLFKAEYVPGLVDIEEFGIKYIKFSDLLNPKDAEGIASVDTKTDGKAFYGDITGIPETDTDDFYAAAYFKTVGDKYYWSSAITCAPNFENEITYIP